MILLIDNYDSFTYNLYQQIGQYRQDITVVRNDAVTIEEIRAMQPDRIVISPGPGTPSQAGICEDVIMAFRGEIPILGICLGHQAICESYGGKIVSAKTLMHGKQSTVTPDTESKIFKGMDHPVKVARYHSLAADAGTLPEELTVTAQTEDGEIMAVEDRKRNVYGLQFHPESILTEEGNQIIENFLGGLEND
jgi:anthranilate synthase component 2